MAENIPMMVVALGFVFTALLFVKGGHRGLQSQDLGTVSDQWIAAYRAAEPSSSI